MKINGCGSSGPKVAVTPQAYNETAFEVIDEWNPNEHAKTGDTMFYLSDGSGAYVWDCDDEDWLFISFSGATKPDWNAEESDRAGIKNKPFQVLGDDFEVDEDGKLSVIFPPQSSGVTITSNPPIGSLKATITVAGADYTNKFIRGYLTNGQGVTLIKETDYTAQYNAANNYTIFGLTSTGIDKLQVYKSIGFYNSVTPESNAGLIALVNNNIDILNDVAIAIENIEFLSENGFEYRIVVRGVDSRSSIYEVSATSTDTDNNNYKRIGTNGVFDPTSFTTTYVIQEPNPENYNLFAVKAQIAVTGAGTGTGNTLIDIRNLPQEQGGIATEFPSIIYMYDASSVDYIVMGGDFTDETKYQVSVQGVEVDTISSDYSVDSNSTTFHANLTNVALYESSYVLAVMQSPDLAFLSGATTTWAPTTPALTLATVDGVLTAYVRGIRMQLLYYGLSTLASSYAESEVVTSQRDGTPNEYGVYTLTITDEAEIAKVKAAGGVAIYDDNTQAMIVAAPYIDPDGGGTESLNVISADLVWHSQPSLETTDARVILEGDTTASNIVYIFNQGEEVPVTGTYNPEANMTIYDAELPYNSSINVVVYDATGTKILYAKNLSGWWYGISEKPFTSIGDGLTVTGDVLSATGGGTSLPRLIGTEANSFTHMSRLLLSGDTTVGYTVMFDNSDNPTPVSGTYDADTNVTTYEAELGFDTEVYYFVVQDDPQVYLYVGSIAEEWGALTEKPFNTIGSGLTVTNGVLSVTPTTATPRFMMEVAHNASTTNEFTIYLTKTNLTGSTPNVVLLEQSAEDIGTATYANQITVVDSGAGIAAGTATATNIADNFFVLYDNDKWAQGIHEPLDMKKISNYSPN
ncbi:hypothetical protein ACFC3Z_07850 [Enterococcus thailandicus]|uniref:hypothetical protein n=1 Tax=Enterococcus thailandicus TaxID=417368 RepID=UPI0035D8BF00